MNYIHTYDSFLNEAEEIGTQKSAALDFVEKKRQGHLERNTFFLNEKQRF